MVKYSVTPEQTFAALAHPVRLKMVERLARRGALSVTDIAKPFSISLPAALKHVRVLERGGVVRCEKRGRTQYCTMQPHALRNVDRWLETQRRFWESSFNRLEQYFHS